MASRRCSRCALNWPTSVAAMDCPQCLGPVSMIATAPMEEDEARRIKAYADFERWLENESPEDRRARQERAMAEEAERAAVLADLEARLLND